jgi:FdhE protein
MSDAPVKSGLMNIGEEAKPPHIVLPDPSAVFIARANRLESLARGHVLEGYLSLIAAVCRAQSSIQKDLSAPTAPPGGAHGVGPPLASHRGAAAAEAEATLLALANALKGVDAPPQFKAVVDTIVSMQPTARRMLLEATLADADSGQDVAAQVLAFAALQVQFTRLAATLSADAIAPVSHGNCPVCDSLPVASAVVSWPQANNTRFCTCSLCASQWHVVRLKCVTCGTTAGVSYPHIEGHPDGLRAETCDTCKTYVKIVYQLKEPALEPFADDTASLDLDMVLKNEGWKRGGRNPFLIGY